MKVKIINTYKYCKMIYLLPSMGFSFASIETAKSYNEFFICWACFCLSIQTKK